MENQIKNEIENKIENKKKINFNNFRIKNKDKILKKNDCLICGGSYSYFNKSTHLNSQKCQKVKQLRNL